jgi:FkbM family methyltransferase
MIINRDSHPLRLIRSKIKTDHFWLYSVYRELRFHLRTIYLKHILRIMRPDYPVQIIKLGSDHGWSLGHRSYLESSTIVSAGLGQDASFDIEYLNKYDARVILIDPTPTSIDHFQDIVLNFGSPKRTNYVAGGGQPTDSYDLSKVNGANLKLVCKALYNNDTEVKFYVPKTKGYNSYSVSNVFKTDRYISVQAVTLNKLLLDLEIESRSIVLVKLDIEGSACEVLLDFLGNPCLPRQILVEFEEVFVFSFSNAKKLVKTFSLLQSYGYKLIHTDKIANFTFELNGRF